MLRSKWTLVVAVALALGWTMRSFAQDAKPAAPKFEIQRATYAPTEGEGGADVTEKVKALVKDGTLSIQVTNQALGGDPAPQRPKQLRVEYVLDGKASVAVAREGSLLAIPPVPMWQQPDKLIAVLKSDAPLNEKSDACRQLAITGTKDAVPVLAALLTDEKLSHMARYALEPIPDPSVDDALRAALGQVKGNLLVGVVNSIGVRRDATALDSLAGLLGDPDKEVASAAAMSLGKIGTSAAAKALDQAVNGAPKEVQSALYDGLLRCGDALASQGQGGEAQAIYDRLRASQADPPIRAAALRGAILVRGAGGAALLVEQLRSPDMHCVAVALRVALELPGAEVTQALAGELTKLPADRQPLLIQALSKRGDQAAFPAILAATKSAEKDVRLAAIRVLPEMGNPAAVEPLVALSTDPDADVARAARDSLATMPSQETDSAVIAMLDGTDAARRVIAIELIASRRMTAAIPKLLSAAEDPNQEIRLAAMKTLEQLGGSVEVAPLLDRLMGAKERKDGDAAEKALSAIAAREENPDQCAQQVIERMAQAAPEQKVALLRILSAVGGSKALQTVRAAVDDPNADVHATAIRTLGKWKTGDAAPILLELAKTSPDEKDKLLCLRSCIGLAGNRQLPDEQRLAICKQGEALIQRDDEKKLLLGALGGIASPDAFAAVMSYLDNPTTKEEACAAVLSIAQELTRGRKALSKNAATVVAPLEKAAQIATSPDLKKRIDAELKEAKAKSGRK
ncbi:MAG: HEAT repeat domain-containing protein [Planctomycetota bacterium]